jgi:DNA-binding NarL/FixJ family response regulator
MPEEALKIAIIEDQPRIREGLRSLIDGTAGFACTGSYGSMEEALGQIGHAVPDVTLVDIGLPRTSGIEGLRLLKGLYPKLPLIMLTVYEDDKRILEALCAGASGYLLNTGSGTLAFTATKNTPLARLLECLKEANTSGAPMSPEIAAKVLALFREFAPPKAADYHLTPHEIRMLRLLVLVEGHNYKTPGTELNVSVNTVRFHMRSIYEKLQVILSRRQWRRR